MESDAKREESRPRDGSAGPGALAGAATLAELPPPGRRTLALLLLNAIFAVVAFGPLATFTPEPTLETDLEGVFFTPSDTYPSIVLLLAAWLLYRRWERLKRIPLVSGPAWLSAGLLLLAGGILAWATWVGAGDLRVPALISTVMGFGCLFGGRRAMRALLLPTLFLLFAIPMPAPLLNLLLYHMQLWTAEFTGLLLHLLGHTAFVAGDLIEREGNSFAIIETCSGVRITETLLMLAILMLDLFRRGPLHAAILLAITPPVAFVVNGVRAVTLILNPHSDITEIHTLQGTAMLLGGLIALYAFDGLLGWLLPRRGPAAAPPAGGSSSAGAAGSRTPWLATGVLAALALLSIAVPRWSGRHPLPPQLSVAGFAEIGDWRSNELKVDRKFLGRIGVQRDLHRRYRRDGEVVKLYAGVGDRDYRPRSVLFSKASLPGSGWNTRERGTLRLEPGGIEATWRVAVSGTRRFLVISWQEEAGGIAGESLRSYLGLDLSPLRRPGEGMVLRLSTRMADSEGESRAGAEARLREFYAALRPKLDAYQARLRGDTE